MRSAGRDVVALCGAGLAVVGVWGIYRPAALIVAGIFLLIWTLGDVKIGGKK